MSGETLSEGQGCAVERYRHTPTEYDSKLGAYRDLEGVVECQRQGG